MTVTSCAKLILLFSSVLSLHRFLMPMLSFVTLCLTSDFRSVSLSIQVRARQKSVDHISIVQFPSEDPPRLAFRKVWHSPCPPSSSYAVCKENEASVAGRPNLPSPHILTHVVYQIHRGNSAKDDALGGRSVCDQDQLRYEVRRHTAQFCTTKYVPR